MDTFKSKRRFLTTPWRAKYSMALVIGFSMILASLIFAMIFHETQSSLVVAWYVSLGCVSIFKTLLSFSITKKPRDTKEQLTNWTHAATVPLLGLIWGLLAYFLVVTDSIYTQIAIVSAICSVATGSLINFSYSRFFSLGFLLACEGPLIAILFTINQDPFFTWVGVCFCVFAVTQLMTIFYNRHVHHERYRLKENNRSLVSRMYETSSVLKSEIQTRLESQGELVKARSLLEATNEELIKEKERAEVTLKSIGDAVMALDAQGNIDFMNSAAELLTGYELAAARQLALTDVLKLTDDGQTIYDPISYFFEHHNGDTVKASQLYATLASKSGRQLSVAYNVSKIVENMSEVASGYVLVFHDISERDALVKELVYQVGHDDLTKLPNRYSFKDQLKSAIDEFRETSRNYIFLYIDLDQFKLVNDVSGHSVGDELLKRMVQLLQRQMSGNSYLARLGGDEFGLLISDCTVSEGIQIAERIRRAIHNYRFMTPERTFDISASIGVVPVHSSSGDVDQLLSTADMACYIAKDSGRDRVHVYREHDGELDKRRREMEWVSRINRAMELNNLRLYYQDISAISEPDSTTRYVEVLVRMHDTSSNTFIRPAEFLPAIERYGSVIELDKWVVRTAFEWYVEQGLEDGKLRMGINLSCLSLSSPKFLAYVEYLLESRFMPASAVCFEVTESVALSNFSVAIQFMNRLHSLGCSFALDDFGSGFSSFTYLKLLPLDILKIDGSFMKDIMTDHTNQSMIKAIGDVGKALGLKTVAEYVDSESAIEKVKELGIDFAQGHIINMPQPLSELSLAKPLLSNVVLLTNQ